MKICFKGIFSPINLILILIALISTININAKNYRTSGCGFVKNFLNDGSHVSGKTWSISTYGTEWNFFANSNGILIYNLNSWKIYSLNNKRPARAVNFCKNDKRLYVSGINEFGYFYPDTTGEMRYVCLSDSIDKGCNIGDLWNIYIKDNNQLLLTSDFNVLIYDLSKNTTQIVKSPSRINCSLFTNGILYVGTSNGIKILVGNKFINLPNSNKIFERKITAITEFKEGILASTEDSSLWYYKDDTIDKYYVECDDFLKNNGIFCLDSSDTSLAVGTIKGGVVIIDIADKTYSIYNETNNLRNNTILSLHFNSDKKLWVGLDNGINLIYPKHYTTPLFPVNNSIGSGYTFSEYNGKYYWGTNRGLYYTRSINANERPIPVNGITGQVWKLTKLNGKLLCTHNHGLDIIKDSQTTTIGKKIGTWDIYASSKFPNSLLVGTYSGLYIITQDDKGKNTVIDIPNLYMNAYSYMLSENDYIWIFDETKGIFRYKIDFKNLKIESSQSYKIGSDGTNIRKCAISDINGEIVFATEQGMFRYNTTKDSIEKSHVLNNIGGFDKKGCLQIEKHGKYIYALTNSDIIRFDTDQKRIVDNLPLNIHLGDSYSYANSFHYLNDSTLILAERNGFSMYSFENKLVNKNRTDPHLARINELKNMNTDSILYTCNYLDKKRNIIIPYEENSIYISWGLSDSEFINSIKTRVRLNGKDWVKPILTNGKEYYDMREGDYIFEVEITLPNGSKYFDSITFTILPPWYRSKVANLIYILLFVFFVVFLLYYYRKKINNIKRENAIKKYNELKDQQRIFETELDHKNNLIEEIRNEKIKDSLKLKKQEILNLQMIISRDRTTLLKIKDELFHLSELVIDNSNAKKIINRLFSNINTNIDSDRIIEKVENEFNILNNDLTIKIKDKYPNMSKNELIMCAYIKMNLSSKEIAPLMNLSIRGVETMRYRLRKKLNIPQDITLFDFFNKQD